MANLRLRIGGTTALLIGVAVALGGAAPVAAADQTFTLFVDGSNGWGLTNASLSIPGPTITVTQWDNVTLLLNGTDGQQHRWFLDYDNDSADAGNEPNSPQFRSTPISWNFTASQNGTYAYRDRNNPSAWGFIVVLVPGSGGGLVPNAISPQVILVIAAGIGLVVALVLVARRMERRRAREPDEPRE